MPYNNIRDKFFRTQYNHIGKYITTISTRNYGVVDVLGYYYYNFWTMYVYSQELDKFTFSIKIANVEEPSDRLIKNRIDFH